MNNTIYIVGPMTGYDNFNFDAFDAAAAKLRQANWIVINPAELDRVYEGWSKYPPEDLIIDKEFKIRVMRRDLDAIMLSSAIFFLDGWEQSNGAKPERALGSFLGLQFYYEGDL